MNNTIKLLLNVAALFLLSFSQVKAQEPNKIIKIVKENANYQITIKDAAHFAVLKSMGADNIDRKYKAIEGIKNIELINTSTSDFKITITVNNARSILNLYFNVAASELDSKGIN